MRNGYDPSYHFIAASLVVTKKLFYVPEKNLE